MSTWLLRIGTALLLLGFAFLLQAIWLSLADGIAQPAFARARMSAAVGFAILVLGWILQRRGR